MKRVANCLYRREDEVLLLQKPRRGWWTCPGGKMEPSETVLETVKREFYEETGLRLVHPHLRGVFTILTESGGKIEEEWMMYCFVADEAEGKQLQESAEGLLQWHPVAALEELPMPEGDRIFLRSVLEREAMMFATFTYTQDMQLVAARYEEIPGWLTPELALK